MPSIDEAIAALRAGAYSEADEILGSLGGGKAGAAIRLRGLWAIAQVMCRKFGDGMEAILEIAGRSRNRSEQIYHKLLSAIGPFEAVLPAEATQEARLRIGDYFLREEKAGEALAWLGAARATAPDDPLALYLDANCRFALYGERQAVREMEAILDQAAAETDRAYFIAGGTAALWYRLGLAHDRMKNPDEAAGYLTKAVALDPDNNSQRLALGDVLIRLGRFDEAIAQLGAIQKFSDGYRFAARLRAVALFRIGQPEAALALLQEVAELDPLDALTFLEMGRVYLARGDLERAELALARAFRTNPELAGLKSAIVILERHLVRHLDPDAGLPQPGSFTIPDEFLLDPEDPALRRRPSLAAGLISCLRTLHTLMLRDLLHHHSHSGMGYLWAIAQPLAYVVALDTVYTMAGHRPPLGISREAYFITGIVPFICFYVHVQTQVASAVTSNLNLLYFSAVKPLVLIAAAALREYLTALVVFVIIVSGLLFYDSSLVIKDPLDSAGADRPQHDRHDCRHLVRFGTVGAAVAQSRQCRVCSNDVLFFRGALFRQRGSGQAAALGPA